MGLAYTSSLLPATLNDLPLLLLLFMETTVQLTRNAQLGYKTQSVDTSIEAELVQFGLWRQMTPAKKEALLKRVTRKIPQLILSAIKQEFKDASPDILRYHYVLKRLGQNWANLLLSLNYQGGLRVEDPLWLARQIADILDDLAIPYYVGGSVASSLQGEVRYTEDLDLVINIQPSQVQPLINRMSGQFYISDIAVSEAMVGQTSSFNVIHLETTEKADIFVMRSDAFSNSKMARRQLHIPDDDLSKSFYICSPEDTVLQKLVWFKMTRNQSQKQWRDILGVLKIQGARLDFDYVWEWANTLRLTEELTTALTEAPIAIG